MRHFRFALVLILFATATLSMANEPVLISSLSSVPDSELIAAKEKVYRKLDSVTELAIKIAEYASSEEYSKNPQSDKMAVLVAELKALRAELAILKTEVDRLAKKYEQLATTGDSQAVLQKEVADLKQKLDRLLTDSQATKSDLKLVQQFRNQNYLQLQYRNTSQLNGQNDGFVARRVRLGFTQKIDESTDFRVTYEFAASSAGVSNNSAAALQVAVLNWKLRDRSAYAPWTLRFGQQNVPVGSELVTGSASREMPERTFFVNEAFPGVRSRGITVSKGVGKNTVLSASVMNSLSQNDREQISVSGPPGDELAAIIGLRQQLPKGEIGLTVFQGDRARLQAGYNGQSQTRIFATEITRRFYSVDFARADLFNSKFFFKGEATLGTDRSAIDPNSTVSGNVNSGVSNANDPRLFSREIKAYYVQLGYDFSNKHQLVLKYENYDRNADREDDSLRSYGLGYNYFVNPFVRFTLAHEIVEDATRGSIEVRPLNNGSSQFVSNKRYNITTLRVQYRF